MIQKYCRMNEIIHISKDTDLFYTVALINHDGEVVEPTKIVRN